MIQLFDLASSPAPALSPNGIAGSSSSYERKYTLKKVDASANAVTVATTSSQTINCAATKSLATQWSTLNLVSDGANWLIV